MVRVMIVDDALFMRRVYGQMLARNNIAVVAEASNGFEAIAKYQEARPDVVLMDITMPGMLGLEALEEIIKLDPGARVITSSAMGQDVFVRRSISRGAKAFVVKPIIERDLVATIQAVMQGK